ncbi:hypothetical protein AURDEDRAFT_178721 [Auricularia subglabra TFB-10046 SS5]|uniref:Uncharacterized protein n=1 Tax=Auricularia subglabra (strain TFB-10046 / SS5) TaxID=717982 RepID=J0CPW5_AURST|nr:hypothetical protein AURDEDRAFT_178721 [Auricularia subglabra TFB-10046 SS5]
MRPTQERDDDPTGPSSAADLLLPDEAESEAVQGGALDLACLTADARAVPAIRDPDRAMLVVNARSTLLPLDVRPSTPLPSCPCDVAPLTEQNLSVLIERVLFEARVLEGALPAPARESLVAHGDELENGDNEARDRAQDEDGDEDEDVHCVSVRRSARLSVARSHTAPIVTSVGPRQAGFSLSSPAEDTRSAPEHRVRPPGPDPLQHDLSDRASHEPTSPDPGQGTWRAWKKENRNLAKAALANKRTVAGIRLASLVDKDQSQWTGTPLPDFPSETWSCDQPLVLTDEDDVPILFAFPKYLSRRAGSILSSQLVDFGRVVSVETAPRVTRG